MLFNFYNRNLDILRDSWQVDDDDNQYSSLTVVGTVDCHIQQASQEVVERFGLNFQTAFSMWCDVNTDIKVGDHLEDENYNYTVRAIQINDYGNNTHLEVALDGGLIDGS